METFIARQPIFDKNQEVFAYELLFRSGLENFFDEKNADVSQIDQVSSKVIGDSMLIHGLDTLTAGKKGFYNVTRQTLLKEYYAFLPKEQTVVEILETVNPDTDILAACQKLKEKGYMLALDDFVDNEDYQSLIQLTDIIKVDFLVTDRSEQKRLADQYASQGIHMLAEKVETWEIFQEAKEMGYTYFQGFFFSKPIILTGKDIPAYKLHYLKILQEIHRPELDYKGLEKIIKMEMSLSYKLLRYINSAFFGWHAQIGSIRHALVLMGEDEVKKWASLVALVNMAKDKADELVVQAIVRAKFCEFLAPLLNDKKNSQDYFLMGMFSLLDAIMGCPLPEGLNKLPISEDIKNALLEGKGRMGTVYHLILAYEKGAWKKIADDLDTLGITDDGISSFYMRALKWADQSFKAN